MIEKFKCTYFAKIVKFMQIEYYYECTKEMHDFYNFRFSVI